MLAVDKFGKRFMDEYPPAPQDTGTRALEFYDADIQDYPRIPCYLVLIRLFQQPTSASCAREG